VLHFLNDEDKPGEVVGTLLDALPPGSYLAASHMTFEHEPGVAAGQQIYREAGLSMQMRDADQFARLAFDGLEMVPPGVVLVSEWRRTATGPPPTPAEVSCYGGVARKLLFPAPLSGPPADRAPLALWLAGDCGSALRFLLLSG
jgi:hypothetical protein